MSQVRREVNAQKEDQPNVGELYIFEVRMCTCTCRCAPLYVEAPPVACAVDGSSAKEVLIRQ